jgi:phenylacetic acid degradation operon negative regulatory protein
MLTDDTSSVAQKLIVTMLGDYRVIAAKGIFSSALVRVLAEFEVSADAARAALSRLVKANVLARTKLGRETIYRLTSEAVGLFDESTGRIMNFGADKQWDGKWTILSFSLHNENPSLRYNIRNQLRSLGFAPLYDRLWLAAQCPPKTAEKALVDLGVKDQIIFRGEHATSGDALRRVIESWDLPNLRSGYERFLNKFPALQARISNDSISPAEAFRIRTQLMDDWREFPRVDPELPIELLPPDWPRADARKVFVTTYAALAPMAEIRFRSLVREGQRSIA